MDISELEAMGLIDTSTEFLTCIGDTPVIYTQEGPLNKTTDYLATLGNKITYVTVPNYVQIIQDPGTQTGCHFLDINSLEPSSQPVTLSEAQLVDFVETNTSQNISEEALQSQLADFFSSTINVPVETNSIDNNQNPTSSKDSIETRPESPQSPDIPGVKKCKLCPRKFSSTKLLKDHMLTHMNDKPHKCSMCYESFNYEINLDLHMALHDPENPYCPVCKKKFSRLASLKAHIMLHEIEESLYCQECGDEFTSPVFFNKHLDEHKEGKIDNKSSSDKKKSGRLKFICSLCNVSFTSDIERKQHLKSVHKIPELKKLKYKKGNSNKCEFCHKCFSKPSQLQRHKRIHTGERPFKCEQCTRAFSQKGSLQIHMLKHTKEKPYACKLCSSTFSQKGNLQSHIKRIHEQPHVKLVNRHLHMKDTPKKPHVKDIPKKTQVKDTSGQLHIRDNPEESHVKCTVKQPVTNINQTKPSGNELYCMCHLCGSIFATLTGLNTHFNKMHGANKNKEKLFPVQNSDSSNKENETKMPAQLSEMCDTSSTLVLKGTTDDERETVLTCHFCHKEFKRPSDLIYHFQTHSHEKPFKCKDCGQCFTFQSALTKHMLTHSKKEKNKKYACSICGEIFSSIHSLKCHKTKHEINRGKSLLSPDISLDNTGNEIIASVVKSGLNDSLVCLDQIDMSSLDASNIILTENGNVIDMTSDIEEECDKNKYKCDKCSLVFKEEPIFKLHQQSHLQKYTCDYCSCKFTSTNLLSLHVQQNHTTPAIGFDCNTCGKQFSSELRLNHHKATHSLCFPWVCTSCNESFGEFMFYKEHVATHHSKSVTKKKIVGNFEKQEEKPPPDSAIQTSDLHDNLKDLITIQPNQVVLIANGDEVLNIVPHKGTNNTTGLEEYTLYSNGNVILNPAGSVLQGTQADVINSGSVETCIFTLQPSTDLSSVSLPQLLSASQQLNRLDGSNVVLTAVEDFQNGTLQLEDTSHTCLTCQKSLNSADEFEEHLKIHNNEGVVDLAQAMTLHQLPASFSCGKCNLAFPSPEDLSNHQQIHLSTNDNVEFFDVQQVCNIDLNATNDLILQESPVEGDSVFKCSVCKMRFGSLSAYNEHYATEHKSQLTTKVPSPKKKTRVNWRQPARRITEEEAKVLSTIEPDNDSEKVLVQSILEKKRYEQPLKEEPKPQEVHRHKCIYCSKSFRKPSDLIRHLRTHTGERPYKCLACNKRFSIKSTARSHLSTHNKDKTYQCYICSKNFASTGSLKIHMRLHTGLKPFVCNICGAKFRTSGHKKAHLLKHDKEKEDIDKLMDSVQEETDSLDDLNTCDLEVDSQELVPSKSGCQYHFSLKSKDQGKTPSKKNNEPTQSNKSETPKNSPQNNEQKILLNIDEEGGVNGVLKYLLSICTDQDGRVGNDEDLFLESVGDDQIIVTITKGDSNDAKSCNLESSSSLESEPLEVCYSCDICNKTFLKETLLEKHKKKCQAKEIFTCTVCMEKFEDKSDFDVHCLAHELDREYTCHDCNESFSLEEELRAHKCIKSTSLDLSLDNDDLFLFYE